MCHQVSDISGLPCQHSRLSMTVKTLEWISFLPESEYGKCGLLKLIIIYECWQYCTWKICFVKHHCFVIYFNTSYANKEVGYFLWHTTKLMAAQKQDTKARLITRQLLTIVSQSEWWSSHQTADMARDSSKFNDSYSKTVTAVYKKITSTQWLL